MIEKQCTITVKVGLHARPANEFAAIAKSAPCEILVGKPGQPLVKGNSPLRLLTLKAHEGDTSTPNFLQQLQSNVFLWPKVMFLLELASAPVLYELRFFAFLRANHFLHMPRAQKLQIKR
jgi:phosphotransferase system HPr (HPr) family protein